MSNSIYQKLFVFLAINCFSLLGIYAQGSLSGTIKSETGEPIPFASVEVVGLNTGVISDIDGNFSISDLPVGPLKISVSSISYATSISEIEIQNGQNLILNVVLEPDALGLSQVVVTGVSNERSRLESSVSISSLSLEAINSTSARTTSELFRSIPGIRSESSGGEGNTNMAARGVPISSGGSKYLQIQEDGLPVLMFGDIAFATQDIFTRADQSINKIEVIRGGSASTSATNSPGGIINFISNTGGVERGSIATSVGLDYRNLRTDFNYGSPIGNNMSFHIGGFFRQGDGPRPAGFTGNQGGQIKANLTKRFNNGYVRFHYKHLNDRSIAYMPMPIQVSGTNANPKWESVAGYDALRGTLHSPYLLRNNGIDGSGSPRQSNVADGMHPVTNSIGAEFSFDLDGWKIENRGRFSSNRGRFVAPFPAEVGKASDIALSVANLRNDTLGTASAGLVYAGTNTAIDGNTNVLRIHMFDTELNNFDNMVNDLKISKSFGKVNTSFGYFTGLQNINMSWLWNSYLTELKGDGARNLDVVRGTNRLSQNGQYAYGVPAWGNCCQRNYNTQNLISAPYLNLGVEITSNLNLDGGIRWDQGRVTGSYAGASQSTMDINGDGIIQAPESSVSSINNAAASPVNYSYDYFSYSVGANYKLNNNSAVFARISKGASAKADRLLFGADVDVVTGNLKRANDGSETRPYDEISQIEIGAKYKFDKGGLFLTLFSAQTDEVGGYEATTQNFISNNYSAFGAELEVALDYGRFDLRGGLTFTAAEITKSTTPSQVGNTPRRLPSVFGTLTPSYSFGKGHSVGINLFGTSSSFAQDNNELKMPGYLVVNPYINFSITKSLVFGVNGNNVFNALGITEAEEGSIINNQNNIVRARPILGRSINAVMRYNF
jgi:outer membrane receptor protein involved in Fe transport